MFEVVQAGRIAFSCHGLLFALAVCFLFVHLCNLLRICKILGLSGDLAVKMAARTVCKFDFFGAVRLPN